MDHATTLRDPSYAVRQLWKIRAWSMSLVFFCDRSCPTLLGLLECRRSGVAWSRGSVVAWGGLFWHSLVHLSGEPEILPI